MLYTGKGDSGNTKLFNSGVGEGVGKDSDIIEALGCVDELTSFLGLCKVHSRDAKLDLRSDSFASILEEVQHGLFSVQAEIGGADKHISEEMLRKVEFWIAEIEKDLPPITTFSLPGGTEISALFDVSRTLARRAERKVVSVNRQNPKMFSEFTIAYLNRLSSLLFALARLSNYKYDIKEESPDYR